MLKTSHQWGDPGLTWVAVSVVLIIQTQVHVCHGNLSQLAPRLSSGPSQAKDVRISVAPRIEPSVRLLRGVPDAQAVVGQIFQMQLPGEAFSGNVKYTEVHLSGKCKTLPDWLYFENNTLIGLPRPSDHGSINLEAAAYATEQNETSGSCSGGARSAFMLRVLPSNMGYPLWRNDVPEGSRAFRFDGTKPSGTAYRDRITGISCKRVDFIITVTLVLNAELRRLSTKEKVSLVHRSAVFLHKPISALSLLPKDDDSALPVSGHARIRVAGPGPQEPGNCKGYSSLLSWVAACDETSQTKDVAAVVERDILNGSLWREVGYKLCGWYVSEHRAPEHIIRSRRKRRNARLGFEVSTAATPTVPTHVAIESIRPVQHPTGLQKSDATSITTESFSSSAYVSTSAVTPSRHSSTASEIATHPVPIGTNDAAHSTQHAQATVITPTRTSTQPTTPEALYISAVSASLSSGWKTLDVAGTVGQTEPSASGTTLLPSLSQASAMTTRLIAIISELTTSVPSQSTMTVATPPLETTKTVISSNPFSETVSSELSTLAAPSYMQSKPAATFIGEIHTSETSTMLPSLLLNAASLSPSSVLPSFSYPDSRSLAEAHNHVSTTTRSKSFINENSVTRDEQAAYSAVATASSISDASSQPLPRVMDSTPGSRPGVLKTTESSSASQSSTVQRNTGKTAAAHDIGSALHSEDFTATSGSIVQLSTKESVTTTKSPLLGPQHAASTSSANIGTESVSSEASVATASISAKDYSGATISLQSPTAGEGPVDTYASSLRAFSSDKPDKNMSPWMSSASTSVITIMETDRSPAALSNYFTSAAASEISTEGPTMKGKVSHPVTIPAVSGLPESDVTAKSVELKRYSLSTSGRTMFPGVTASSTDNAVNGLSSGALNLPNSEKSARTSERTERSVTTDLDPANEAPILVNPLDAMQVFLGSYFELQIPQDTFYDYEDGNTRNLTLDVVDEHGEALTPQSWLQFNDSSQTLYGMPLSHDNISGSVEFIIEAKDSVGAATRNLIEVFINETSNVEPSFTFLGQFDLDFSKFLLRRDRIIDLIWRLSSYFGDPTPDGVHVISVREGSVIVEWTNATISVDSCNEDAIQNLYERIVTNGTINEEFQKAMSEVFPVYKLDLNWHGVCGHLSYSDTTEVATTAADVDSPDILVVTLVPIILFVGLLISVLILFWIFCRRKTSGQFILDDEKPIFTKSRKPIFMEGELEMTDVAKRSRKPIIMSPDPEPDAFSNPACLHSDQPDPPPYTLPVDGLGSLFVDPDFQTSTPNQGLAIDDPDEGYVTPPPPYRLPPLYLSYPGSTEV